MIRLTVSVCLPDGEVIDAARIAVADPDRRGALRGEFQYLDTYLGDPRAFPLDPINLPLVASPQVATSAHTGVHGVIEDALPDDWGRGLMVRRFALTREQRRVPNLLPLLGANGLGALMFRVYGEPRTPAPDLQEEHPTLERLMQAALRYQEDQVEGEDPDLVALFRAGGTLGGARPKALVIDQGESWIAKFPAIKDTMDLVRIEAACLALAGKAGLQVPAHRVEVCGGRPALLLRRFDVTRLGRNHAISFQSLLDVEGYYFKGYGDLADVVRQVAARPAADLKRLYRQAALNAAIGNTDDHLKNFQLLRTDQGWELSPAFDLLPDVEKRREHILSFGAAGNIPDRDALVGLGSAFGLSRQATRETLEHVTVAMRSWQAEFEAAGVPDEDIRRLEPGFQERMRRIAPMAAVTTRPRP